MSTLTYKAAYYNDYITDVNDIKVGEVTVASALGAKQIRIEVHSASVNPIDWKLAKGGLKAFFSSTFPSRLGYDVSGVVVAVGPEATKFKVGDEVFGSLDAKAFPGAIAEYAETDESGIWHKPASLSFEQAASLGVAAKTAFEALLKTKAGPGKSVFVSAGAGGVGTFAIQFAKHYFKVDKVATTVSTQKVDLVKSLGATDPVDYKKDDFTKVLKQEYDIVIDNTADINAVDILKPNNNPHSQIISTVSLAIFKEQDSRLKDLEIDYEFFFLDAAIKGFAEAVNELLDAGKLQITIDSIYEFTEQGVRDAITRSIDGHATGKIIIKVKN
ncbi:hypothetical protein H4219_002179 [Mycoemilia scoparia]|uniref:Enoyl reductase (ER) domain-containing protein n=1 Tax=Mycoemilia scoparia TaxID=417184 RepID=A0A9W8A6A8_9FUNG|nr:hypothetical protein H4219_002179 [Mycoemilia scoparia]